MDYDAVVVGAGPNGLTTAARLAQLGARVCVIEAGPTVGGGARSAALISSGVRHDICSAVHPLGAISPAFAALDLAHHGLTWLAPPLALAHALGGDRAAVLDRDPTALPTLGPDAARWERTFRRLDHLFDGVLETALAPVLRVPPHPVAAAHFGARGVLSATAFGARFAGDAAPALFAGIAAHTGVPLETWLTSAPALMLVMAARRGGWPVARGGSQSIADALASVIIEHGGTIECDRRVASLDELPKARAVLLDVSARQLADIAGARLPARYVRRLLAFRHGVGSFKVDYILSEAVPWLADACRRAGTVHVGGAMLDVAAAEHTVAEGSIAEQPFVLVGQPTLVDASRAPGGEHVLWAYCHVPQGRDLVPHHDEILGFLEARIEQYAPGFRDTIEARHVMGPTELEAHNPNLHGGDIGIGSAQGLQLLFRPMRRVDPYRTPADGIYLCSAATPPGGGVHGMCGWNAAGSALRHTLQDLG